MHPSAATRIVSLQREGLSYQAIGALLADSHWVDNGGASHTSTVCCIPCTCATSSMDREDGEARSRQGRNSAADESRWHNVEQFSGQLRSLPCTGVGKYQDVFVSGSIFAMDSSSLFDFFPDIYYEDWS
jgi:hypothetical protein